ncbi:MAG: YhjD/YihY/BrkB family envelope integrity protein [Acidimicrobiales bacterium]
MTDVKDLALALKDRISRHRVTIFAAAVAFFAFLALIPALTAVIGVYGLVADPDEVTRQITNTLSGAPDSTREFLTTQMTEIAAGSSGALGLSVGVGLAIALFSASGAVANLLKSLNVAYEIEDTRKPWTLRGTALLLMLGGVVVLTVTMFLMAALPPLLSDWGLGDNTRLLVNIVRYPALGLVMAASLSVLYRVGPDHDGNDRPLSPKLFTAGGLTATVLFVVLSILFSFYTANLGSYGETYGPLATIIVLLLWFQLSALAIIVGAELDAELADREWRERSGLENRDSVAKDGDAAAAALQAAMTHHDTDAVIAQWHRRGVHRHPLFGDLAVPDQLRNHLDEMFAAIPDLALITESVHATEDDATVRHRLTGTFTGSPWCGVDANEREVDLAVVLHLRLEDGFIVQIDEIFDSADLADQLGFRPGDTSVGARLSRGFGRLKSHLTAD